MANIVSAASYLRKRHLPYLPNPQGYCRFKRFFMGKSGLPCSEIPYVGKKHLGIDVCREMPDTTGTIFKRIDIDRHRDELTRRLYRNLETIGFSRDTINVARLRSALDADREFFEAINLRSGEERTIENVLRAVIWRCGDEREVLEATGINEVESYAKALVDSLTALAGAREISWLGDQIFNASQKYSDTFLQGIYIGSAAASLKAIRGGRDHSPVLTAEKEADFMLQMMKRTRADLHKKANYPSHKQQGCECNEEGYHLLGWMVVSANPGDIARAGRIAGVVIAGSYSPDKYDHVGRPKYYYPPLHLAGLPVCGEINARAEESFAVFYENAIAHLTPGELFPVSMFGGTIASYSCSYAIHPDRIGKMVKFVSDNAVEGRMAAYDRGIILGTVLSSSEGASKTYFDMSPKQYCDEIRRGAIPDNYSDNADFLRGIQEGQAAIERSREDFVRLF